MINGLPRNDLIPGKNEGFSVMCSCAPSNLTPTLYLITDRVHPSFLYFLSIFLKSESSTDGISLEFHLSKGTTYYIQPNDDATKSFHGSPRWTLKLDKL